MNHCILKKRLLALVFVIISVVMLIMTFIRKVDDRIEERNLRYLQDATIQVADATDIMISNSKRSLEMVAGIVENIITSPEVKVDDLNRIACETPFDYIEFIDETGTRHMYDGKTICSIERESYINGMMGKTGVDAVRDSRITDDNLVICYTPLRYENKIIGVLEGMMAEDAFAIIKDAEFFGYKSKSYICKKDGNIIIGTNRSLPKENIVDLFKTGDMVSDEQIDMISSAIEEGEIFSYEYLGSVGTGSACIVPLEESGLVLVRTMPSKITNQMKQSEVNDTFKLQVLIFLLFLLFGIVLFLDYQKEKKKLVTEKYESNCIVEAIKHLYNRLVLVNLIDMTYKVISDDNVYPVPVERNGRYEDIIEYLKGRMVYADNVCDVNEKFSKEYLRENLTANNPYMLYDYCVNEEKQQWIKTAVIRLDADSVGKVTRVLLASEDVSKLKQKDIRKLEAMKKSYEEAWASSDKKSELISKMSDGIKTPMDKIIDMAEKAQDNAGDNDKVSECLEMVRTSGRYLLELLNEITDMSKIESKEKYFEKKVFNIKYAVQEMAGMFEPDLKEKELDLVIEYKAVWNEEVIGDCTRIKQALANILVNSIKYTSEKGHITLSVRERQSDKPGYGLYEFTVEDDGNGLFGVQANESGKELGITISYNIVRMMGGNIEFTSKKGEGSCYIVILYLQKAVDAVDAVD